MMRIRLHPFFYAFLLASAAACTGTKPDESALTGRPVFELSDRNIPLDPGKNWEAGSIVVTSALFDPLFRFGADGTIRPNLASRLPEIDADGTTWLISLRTDVPFHDDPCFPGGKGRIVAAGDVVATILRISLPDNKSGLFSLLKGKILGLDAYNKDPKTAPAPVGLTAVSGSELKIVLGKPFPQLLGILAMPSFGIVPPEAVSRYGEEFARHPVGSGPYRLVRYSPERIDLEAVPGHFSLVAGTAPSLLAFAYFEDKWNAFKDGQLDQLSIPPQNLHAYLDANLDLKPELTAAGYGLRRVKLPFSRFLIFNFARPPIDNLHLRRAVAMAVPWSRLVDEPDYFSASLVPRAIPGYLPLSIPYDPDTARAELALAGYPGGRGLGTLLIRMRWFESDLRDGAVVQDALAEIGIRSRLVYRDTRLLEEMDLGFGGWTLDYPDASNVFGLFASAAAPPDGYNHGRYGNPQFDARLETAGRLPPGPERTREYEALNQLLFDDLAAVAFRQTDDFIALGPRLAGLRTDPLGYIIWPEVRMAKTGEASR
jgi:oligopeptide transport system substrate-binding protein